MSSTESCLFCRIVSGKIPAGIVHSDDQVVAFRDINPQAPHHVLVCPRRHIDSLNEATADDEALLGHALRVGARLAKDMGVAGEGYRTVINCQAGAGQTVFHIHVHVLGGRAFGWPPG